MDEIDNIKNSSKKETILERLNKRNKQRKNYLETKCEIRSKNHMDFEEADNFAQIFSDRAKAVEENINNIQTDCSDLHKNFITVNNDLQELQKYLSNSTLFLPDYNIKTFQNVLNDLTLKCEDLKQKLMPKKKFGFQKKKLGIKEFQQGNNDETDLNEKSTTATSSFVWTLSNKKNEYVLLSGIEVNKKDLTISDVENCFIEIRGHAGSLQILNATNCIFLCGPISRSVFVEKCNDNYLIAACQQLRLHFSCNIKLYLHVTCRAIIEDCNKIEVNKYNYRYDGIDLDFVMADLNMEINNYEDIIDFNWLSSNSPSPNWKLMNTQYAPDHWDDLRDDFVKKYLS